MHKKSSPGEKAVQQAAAVPAQRRLTSSELFAGGNQILIQHGPAEYLLRITRQGKLILTK
jgi:hemin uptake protein HemP